MRGAFFMRKIWDKIDNQIQFGSIFFLVLALVWIVVTLGISGLEKATQEIRAFLESKILLVALVFLGKYLFFPHYRNEQLLKWIFPAIFLLFFGCVAGKVAVKELPWFYYLLVIADIGLWAYFIAEYLEIIGLVIARWNDLEIEDPTIFLPLWQRLWKEILKTGFLLTIAASLIYFYLVSSFLVDTVFYSYLLLVPILTVSLVLYLGTYAKIQKWVGQELQLIDHELSVYLGWSNFKGQTDFRNELPWVEYLFQVRNYLYIGRKPVFSVSTLIWYLFLIGFILALPYLFGIAIEV
jgi:hypothetical protein